MINNILLQGENHLEEVEQVQHIANYLKKLGLVRSNRDFSVKMMDNCSTYFSVCKATHTIGQNSIGKLLKNLQQIEITGLFGNQIITDYQKKQIGELRNKVAVILRNKLSEKLQYNDLVIF